MRNKAKAIKIIQQKTNDPFQPKGDVWHGYLDESHGMVEVPGKEGYYYYRTPRGGSGEYEIGEARSEGSVSSIANLAVTIKQDPNTGERVIVGVDAMGHAYSGATGGPASFSLPDHHTNHELNQRDQIDLRSEQIVQNRLEPNASTRTVTIREGPYVVNGQVEWLISATSSDLSAYYPTSGSKFVWVSLGLAGAITVTDDGITDPELLVYPTGDLFVIGYVQLRASKQLIEWSDIFDMRFRNVFTPVPAPTQRGQILRADASLEWELYNKGTQYQVLTGGVTDPTYGAVALDQATAISGHLLVANKSVFDKPRLKSSGVFVEYNTVQDCIDNLVSSDDEIWIPEGTWNEVITGNAAFVARLLGCGKRENIILTSNVGDGLYHITVMAQGAAMTLQNLTVSTTHGSGAAIGASLAAMTVIDCNLIGVAVGAYGVGGPITLSNCNISGAAVALYNSSAGPGDGITMIGGQHSCTQLYSNVGADTISIYNVQGNRSGSGTLTYLDGSALHDITSYTADATPDPSADYLISLDATDGVHKKILPDNLFTQANLIDGAGAADRIPVFSDADTLTSFAELVYNSTSKYLNLNTNIWRLGAAVLDLDFTGTSYDTAAECAAVGVKFHYAESAFENYVPGTLVFPVSTYSFTHAAGEGWEIESIAADGGPAIYIPLMRPGNWEIELRVDLETEVTDEFSIFVGYITGSGHVGAYAEIVDDDALEVSYKARLYTNDGDDTYTERYAGAADVDYNPTWIIKLKMENSCLFVWDDQDDAWHEYVGRQGTVPYTASGLFIQAVGTPTPAVQLERLILTYLL